MVGSYCEGKTPSFSGRIRRIHQAQMKIQVRDRIVLSFEFWVWSLESQVLTNLKMKRWALGRQKHVGKHHLQRKEKIDNRIANLGLGKMTVVLVQREDSLAQEKRNTNFLVIVIVIATCNQTNMEHGF